MIKIKISILLLLFYTTSQCEENKIYLDFPKMGQQLLEWIQNDDALVDKGRQVLRIYGTVVGNTSQEVGRQVLTYHSPDQNVDGAVKFVGGWLQWYGEHLKDAPLWEIPIHAYVTYRLTKETLRYMKTMSGIVAKKIQRKQSDADEESAALETAPCRAD